MQYQVHTYQTPDVLVCIICRCGGSGVLSASLPLPAQEDPLNEVILALVIICRCARLSPELALGSRAANSRSRAANS
eukprot:8686925-Pyramimonas_sp.AAC.1